MLICIEMCEGSTLPGVVQLELDVDQDSNTGTGMMISARPRLHADLPADVDHLLCRNPRQDAPGSVVRFYHIRAVLDADSRLLYALQAEGFVCFVRFRAVRSPRLPRSPFSPRPPAGPPVLPTYFSLIRPPSLLLPPPLLPPQ